MAFRFKLTESFEEGFRRIALEQIERAQAQLKEATHESLAVHETRKSLKRLRALLRLVRPQLGDNGFRSENARLREIGQELAGARDRFVLLETVGKLEAASNQSRKDIGQALRDVLSEQDNDRLDAAALRQAQGHLNEAKRRLGRLRLQGNGFAVVGPGLRMSYRRARRAFYAAYADQTDEAFHEWRKGTQQHWRHMQLLSRAWPDCLNARVSEARRLSQLVGDDHDLAMLAAFARSNRKAFNADRVQEIETIARKRQAELRTIAHSCGERLFAEGSKALENRIATYWEAAVALKALEPEEREEKVSFAPRRRPQRKS